MIFPWIEHVQANNDAKGSQGDCATELFCNLCRWFRIVILQDAVFLRRKFPDLTMWRESPFTHPLFLDFERRLIHESKNSDDVEYRQVFEAMPILATQIQTQYQNVINSLATYNHSGLVQMEQFIDNGVKTIVDRLDKWEGAIQFVDALFSTGVTLPRVSLSLNLPKESPSQDSASTSISSNPFSTIQSTASAMSATIVQQDSQADGQIQSVEQYHLSRHVKTVIQLWEEYDQGLAKRPYLVRGPSIRSLDEQFGRDWRKKDDCRKAYSRRRRIWEAVIRAAKNLHLSENEVVERIEQWRSNQSKMSLTALNELLEKSLKDRIDPVDSGVWGVKDIELRQVM
jgi:hypothetical protein